MNTFKNYYAGCRCGLMSLDSNGGEGAIPSISTIITGWFGSLWARFILSLHWLKSSCPLIWNTIWALSGICSSVSGCINAYLLNSAERVRCSFQKISSFDICNLLQKKFPIKLPVIVQVFIGIGQCISIPKRRNCVIVDSVCFSPIFYLAGSFIGKLMFTPSMPF